MDDSKQMLRASAWPSGPSVNTSSGSGDQYVPAITIARVLITTALGVAAWIHAGPAAGACDRPKACVLDTRALDGLRAVATLWIFAFHYLVYVWTRNEVHLLGGKVQVNLLGEAAVTAFYMLSGFVLALHHRGSFAWGSFYVKRAARILPLYYASCVVIFLSQVGGHAACEASFGSPFRNINFCGSRLFNFLPYGCFVESEAAAWTPTWRVNPDAGWTCVASVGKAMLTYLCLGSIVPNVTPANEPAWTISVFFVMCGSHHASRSQAALTRSLTLRIALSPSASPATTQTALVPCRHRRSLLVSHTTHCPRATPPSQPLPLTTSPRPSVHGNVPPQTMTSSALASYRYLAYPPFAAVLARVPPSRVRACAYAALTIYSAGQVVLATTLGYAAHHDCRAARPMLSPSHTFPPRRTDATRRPADMPCVAVLLRSAVRSFGWTYNWAPSQLPLLAVGALAAVERLDDAAAATRADPPPRPRASAAAWAFGTVSLVVGLVTVYRGVDVAESAAGTSGWNNKNLAAIKQLSMLALPPVMFHLIGALVLERPVIMPLPGTGGEQEDGAGGGGAGCDGVVVWLLQSRVLSKVSELSLGIYLLHMGCAQAIRTLDFALTLTPLTPLGVWTPLSAWGEALAAAGLTAIASWVSAQLVERPAAKAIIGLWEQRVAKPAQTLV
jgi:peptidoglycan/LPS O-acetylase OafA/YrhL